MKKILVILALVASSAGAQSSGRATSISGHIAKIISRGDGRAPESAYKVASVHEEYEVMKALGLTPTLQALVIKKKPYDRLSSVDPTTGLNRDVWFDISSFYPEF
jgi:hypothetical protein